MSTVKISEYTGNISGSNINVSATGSFGRLICTTISASTGQFDANTIFIGGTSFNKTNLDDLKAGKSLNTSQIEIGGVSFTKAEIERLKEGKTITTSTNRLTKRVVIPSRAARPSKGSAANQVLNDIQKVDAIVNTADDSTFIQSNTTGAFDFIVNNTSSLAITTSSVDISVPVFLPSITGSTSFTGSTDISGSTTVSGSFDQSGSFNSEGGSTFTGSFGSSGSFDVDGNTTVTGSFNQSGSFSSEGSSSFTGSFEQSGSTTFTGGGFTVNNMLDLLANFGQGGIPTGSGQGGVAAGDINLDGQVNVNDALLVLAGYGNPNIIANNTTLPSNINHQFIGPQISIQANVTLTIPTGSSLQIT